jgi:hypothetical protein
MKTFPIHPAIDHLQYLQYHADFNFGDLTSKTAIFADKVALNQAQDERFEKMIDLFDVFDEKFESGDHIEWLKNQRKTKVLDAYMKELFERVAESRKKDTITSVD